MGVLILRTAAFPDLKHLLPKERSEFRQVVRMLENNGQIIVMKSSAVHDYYAGAGQGDNRCQESLRHYSGSGTVAGLVIGEPG
jgi:hypothetical protein